ncbi:uncharacterized protein A1O9_00304 [Exophiala aquamarina CBS 119918]|uniref:FAD dependent oxidoreductase domain-containing protein n=1 Tax=Exophiala aquamarina CBS 119918 TaxID=1182545 RepID=A0A072PRH5_9EURO|nr:uncharacterized protein A1O9_00304 [Exophiala aquamarina CBS 119918]KEF62332.1 hypothetical protein A1O9_00304 [Exophiala aquamarina CBS 119918]
MSPVHHLPASKTFPHPTSTTSYWRTELSPLDRHRSTPELPCRVNIAIIGSGMSGVSIAYHLLKNGSSKRPEECPSILLLEARQLCSGATGRNGGHTKLASIHMQKAASLPNGRGGVRAAEELVAFQVRQIQALKSVIEEEAIDCDFLMTRSFDVFLERELARERTEMVRQMTGQGVDTARREVQILEGSAEVLQGVIPGAYAALNVPAAQLWPYKFVSGLLSSIIDKINFQTETQVDSVSSTPDAEGYYILSTKSRGSIRAKKVVFATNAYTAALLPELYEDKIVPVRGTASHVVRRDQSIGRFQEIQQRVNTYNLAYGGTRQDYLVHRPDGGVIFGGGYCVFGSHEELIRGTVDDSEVAMEKEMTAYFERLMTESYRDWAVSGAKVDRIWTGIMGTTPDGYPHIGVVPGRRNQFICAGFNGAGMLHIFLSAKGLTQIINDGVDFKDTGIPSILRRA